MFEIYLNKLRLWPTIRTRMYVYVWVCCKALWVWNMYGPAATTTRTIELWKANNFKRIAKVLYKLIHISTHTHAHKNVYTYMYVNMYKQLCTTLFITFKVLLSLLLLMLSPYIHTSVYCQRQPRVDMHGKFVMTVYKRFS